MKMNLLPWPDELDRTILAKSAKAATGTPEEGLASHTAWVLTMLAQFIRLRPQLPAQLHMPRLWHCLYWATFLHDFGKVAPTFQSILRGDGDPTLKKAWSEQRQRHEVFSLAFIDWINNGLDENERLLLMAAIISHHRDADEIHDIYNLPKQSRLSEQLALLPSKHVRMLHDWLLNCGWPWAMALGLDKYGVERVGFVGDPELVFPTVAIERIRSWLLNYHQFIKDLSRQTGQDGFVPLITLRGHILSADHSGSAHAPSMLHLALQPDDVVGRKFDWPAVKAHQRGLSHEPATDADPRALHWPKGSALLTAPTGSGKTEAALLWAACQMDDTYHPPRLFYTLPYQASMNAMLRRLTETFGDDYVEIQHGRALLASFRWLMEKGEQPENAARVARERSNLARLHYPPVRVFSPYQMLKGMYRLKGYEAQLIDYHNGLFVFDEIHAYEVKRLALILRTIAYLRRHYNARFLVMSATFPTLIREWLAEALGEVTTITATPALYGESQRHCIRLVEGHALDEANLARIRAEAQAGKSVLVVCNVVARAQKVYETLSNQLKDPEVEIILLHGRFNMRDRSDKEKRIRRRTGADSPEKGPTVLVATQAVEVSLDIDLDTLYSEAAPLEALVQRFGRINRRGNQKDSDENKVLADVHVFTTPPDEQKKIYDPLLVERTLALLARHDGQPVDESAIGDWLDDIYEGEIADKWREEFTKTAAEFNAAVVNTLRPFQSDRAIEAQFDKLFDGMEVLPVRDVDDYEALIADGKAIKASELFVPLSYGQYAQIANAGLARALDEKRRWPVVVKVPYTPEQGLDLSDLARQRNEEEEPGI